MRLLARFTAWPDSTNRRIFRAAVVIGLLTVVAKAATAAKDILVARWFGRGDELDAFLVAYLVPSFFMSLVVGALQVAFVPTFIQVRERQGAEAAQKLLSNVMLLSASILTPLTILLAILAPHYLHYLGSSFSATKLHLTRELLYLMLPFVVFGGVAIFAACLLNAGEKFALGAATPLITPLVIIAFMEFGTKRLGVFSLAGGVVVGSLLEAALLWRALKGHGLRLTPRWSGLDSNTRTVLTQFAPMLAGTFLMCFTSVVDQSMAAMLGSGSVAALSYGNKVVQGLLAIGVTGLATAALPYFSKMVAQNDWNGCRHTMKRYSVLVGVATVPVTVFLIVFSQPIVKLLFQRGAFTVADARLVSGVQLCYALQIPFYICATFFVRFLSSIKRNDVLMYGSAISLVLDIVLNIILMRWLGVAGIALSTSLVYMISFLYAGAWSARILSRQRLSAPLAAQVQEGIR